MTKAPRFTNGELARKALHISFGTVLLLTLHLQVFEYWHYLVLLVAGLTLSLTIKFLEGFPQIAKLIAPFDKDDYLPAQGMVYFYCTFVLLLTLTRWMELPDRFIMHPVLMLTLADPASFFIGKGWGKRPLPVNRRKTVEGTLAGMLVASVAGLLFVSPFAAVLIGSLAMMMDVVDLKIGNLEIDDNLLIPLAAFILLLSTV
ncbi:MAG: Cytidylyltransferase family protein [candidate division WS6 bacterium OLB20]|uniref:Cytidylyltransferase family protein n=1 Tax=candidate division WS6 bacterium OLB20 TaxID=1617426 RepID=A0A136LXX4_9BACT|nr:MAG: Cytidylyltransferase family protein [candidate division WS6 bacterium OLB20]